MTAVRIADHGENHIIDVCYILLEQCSNAHLYIFLTILLCFYHITSCYFSSQY